MGTVQLPKHSPARRERRHPESGKASPLTRLVTGLPTRVRFTNLDKVLYPNRGLTKAALVAYYAVMAERILPYVAHRPLTMLRCPDGRERGCFFQKHPRVGMPSTLRRIQVEERGGEDDDYMVLDDEDGLLGAAQYGCLELHVWGSREDKLERPDTLVFDLDPDPTLPWTSVVDAAREVRALLQRVDLVSFVKTTGGKGLHVVVPIERKIDWDHAKDFTRAIAARLADTEPSRYTDNPLKVHRKGKIFVDYLRNARGATAVAPYSTRATPLATVATPIAWGELEEIDPVGLDLTTVPQRVSEMRREPWPDYAKTRQSVTAAMRREIERRAR